MAHFNTARARRAFAEVAALEKDPRELIADGFSFPTSLAFDAEGSVYVAESGLPFGGNAPGGRIWLVGPNGSRKLIAEGLGPPVNGLTHWGGSLFISEGASPGRISRLDRGGRLTTVRDGLPGGGNYQTNMTAIGPDEKLYFSQGAMTNSGIVGTDAYQLGWLRKLPHAHDIPGMEVVLAGENAESQDPLSKVPGARAVTGAFSPFGTPTSPGQRISGSVPCTAAVMRCNPDGSELELVAWGLRNAYGLGFDGSWRLLAIDQGADDRGSRPVGDAPDALFEIHSGAWYGWPDFIAGTAITDGRFRPQRGPAPRFLLANHNELPPPERALVEFPSHSAAVKFAIVPREQDLEGQLIVALFGDERPMTAPGGPAAGRNLIRIDPHGWKLHAMNVGVYERPIDVGFDPAGDALHVLDFGKFEMTANGMVAEPRTGKLWRVPVDKLV